MSEAENDVPARDAVDHLLLGAADLESGTAWLEEMTGVKAVPGGSHPGFGSRNALISLGRRQYLEVIAPDPLQEEYNFPVDVRSRATPRLVAWAALTANIDVTATMASLASLETVGPRPGSRARPDGKILEWKTLWVPNRFGVSGVEPIPFFIEWGSDSLHPSEDSPGGCSLQSFEIEHPRAAGVGDLLKKLGINAEGRRADESSLRAVLRTPKGEVELT